MRLGELSTGLRFAGAGGRAIGKVVGGRGPEDTIKRGTGKSNLYCTLCYLRSLLESSHRRGLERFKRTMLHTRYH